MGEFAKHFSTDSRRAFDPKVLPVEKELQIEAYRWRNPRKTCLKVDLTSVFGIAILSTYYLYFCVKGIL